MDATAYRTQLAELRSLRDEVKRTRAALAKLETKRDKQITALASYEKATAERIAPAAGLSVAEVALLAPALAPQPIAATSPEQDPAPTDTPADNDRPTTPTPARQHELAAAPTASPADATTPTAEADLPVQEQPPAVERARTLPPIPDGPNGDDWFTHTRGLASTRPNFTQQARATVFLDTTTGLMAHRDTTQRLDLRTGSAADILTAVTQSVEGPAERIYITAGDPWHRDTDRYPYLKDAVAAWLNAPTPGWRTDTGRGKDRMAGHFVHPRNPVGRYQRETDEEHVEIRSVGEWFDPAGADPATIRDAFVHLWRSLRFHWSDAVLMGSPSQTGRDLWSRTIPLRGQHAEGYPVLSEELRGLLHATAGQGRTQLLTPPQVPEQLPGLVEYDRTFAYAKHTWKSPVGTPRRITAATFASWSEQQQTKALFGCGHWHIRATVPAGWNHVGLLPAPTPGDRAWHYPNTPGATFTTWAGGPEIHAALTNPHTPWHVEILDGILWDDGKPLDDWAKRLKEAWSRLNAQASLHGDPAQRTAAHLAARAVRAILLYGIGAFAQRPRIVTGTTPRTMERDLPADAEILGFDDHTITWQRPTGFARDPYAHPEWAAGIWSAARAALLTQRMRADDTHVGALHTPPGTVVAFRTDALYLTQPHDWPYHGQPGDYLLKGQLNGPLPAPTSEDELLTLRDAARTALARKDA